MPHSCLPDCPFCSFCSSCGEALFTPLLWASHSLYCSNFATILSNKNYNVYNKCFLLSLHVVLVLIYTFITDKCKQLSERYRHTIRFTPSPLLLLRHQVATEDTMSVGLHPSSSPQPLSLSSAFRMSPCCIDLQGCLWDCWRRYDASRPSPACPSLREDSGG
jgi:hypothetical protein